MRAAGDRARLFVAAIVALPAIGLVTILAAGVLEVVGGRVGRDS